MNFDDFVETFCESLRSVKSIDASIGTLTKITGGDLASLNNNMFEFEEANPGVIHKAGTYIICGDSKVLYIGEGGKGRNEDSGNMGHRVYQHLAKKEWSHEVRQIFYVPVIPGEFGRLGEQIAFALHYSKTGGLPKYQNEWR